MRVFLHGNHLIGFVGYQTSCFFNSFDISTASFEGTKTILLCNIGSSSIRFTQYVIPSSRVLSVSVGCSFPPLCLPFRQRVPLIDRTVYIRILESSNRRPDVALFRKRDLCEPRLLVPLNRDNTQRRASNDISFTDSCVWWVCRAGRAAYPAGMTLIVASLPHITYPPFRRLVGHLPNCSCSRKCQEQ
jgi:hypothetical protein